MDKAQMDAAIRAAWKVRNPFARTRRWEITELERAAFRAGELAGLRAAAEIAEQAWRDGLRSDPYIRDAADALEKEL